MSSIRRGAANQRLLTRLISLALMWFSTAVASQLGLNPCRPYAEETCGANMAQVNSALLSDNSLWAFITSPNTGYFERQVAAQRGSKLFSVQWIPKLIETRHALLKEFALHRFGVQWSPVDARGPIRNMPRARVDTAISRTILGERFVVPERWIDYPETNEQLATSPWPFQVGETIGLFGLGGLYGKVISASDPATVEAIALALPCEDYETARELIDLTLLVASAHHYVSPKVFGTWLNALHNQNGTPAVERAASGIMGLAARSLGGKKADESWAMLQVLGLEELGKWASGYNYQLMDELLLVHPLPNTLVLALSRYLENPPPGTVVTHNRAFWARTLLQVVGQSPTTPQVPPGSSDQAKRRDDETLFASLGAWFSKNEPTLIDNAAAESALIESVREKMSSSATCKP